MRSNGRQRRAPHQNSIRWQARSFLRSRRCADRGLARLKEIQSRPGFCAWQLVRQIAALPHPALENARIRDEKQSKGDYMKLRIVVAAAVVVVALASAAFANETYRFD